MARRSLDSERPILAPSLAPSARNPTNRYSSANRYSTYSTSPSFTSSFTTSSDASGMQEIKTLTQGFEKLESKRLNAQRFVPTEQKSDNMSKLALGAKLDRALGRRLTNQDFVRKPITEKSLPTVNEKAGSVKA